MGVDEVFIGYPYLVGQDNGNEYNVTSGGLIKSLIGLRMFLRNTELNCMLLMSMGQANNAPSAI